MNLRRALLNATLSGMALWAPSCVSTESGNPEYLGPPGNPSATASGPGPMHSMSAPTTPAPVPSQTGPVPSPTGPSTTPIAPTMTSTAPSAVPTGMTPSGTATPDAGAAPDDLLPTLPEAALPSQPDSGSDAGELRDSAAHGGSGGDAGALPDGG